ncbi:MAG: PAS domain S-box protein [Algoriphagus sp.]|jgi:PAS domain S-box-containing protein|uniref:PAS domain S-box protein n=1 Tax=Algoriphagus sp. TaxID=1872435 RepID=UPI00271FCF6F|nr:PAS domain S-box protein [Algoriphagus sp.]MDO8965605.1 PAS domain S-box protein [Algoriphagus sp.]MDP2041865.1 PAS domain S-box protein [Algoriphagus sp.]MDP3198216.1 PAS domain S-box protein [Algoriphagus sp.]MDP3473568.1 PAS domain S-box protein [Algoriphagus sp.]
MRKDEKSYHILIIEDNLGDNILIEEYLTENILNPKLIRADTFQSAKVLLENRSNTFDIIFLDLSLPDLSGEPLIVGVLNLAVDTPVVALTGFSDLDFSIKSLGLGISDYLLKDELTPIILYKSVIYAIQRRKFTDQIQKSEKRYSDLFQLSPLPMWVYDLETLHFLNINKAAISHYGYSDEEFLAMTILDIRPQEDAEYVLNLISDTRQGHKVSQKSVSRHKKKNGELIFVEVTFNLLIFNGRDAVMVLVNDITERAKYVETIEKQNQTFREIAWIQSHVVRAPLARLLGLVNLLESEIPNVKEESLELIQHIKNSAFELDEIVRDISKKSEQIEPLDKNEI